MNETIDFKYGGLYNPDKNNFTFTKESILNNPNFINIYEKNFGYMRTRG
jgi:hypothetical protein